MSQANNATGGIGFAGVLFLLFLTLKLCSVIDWSWWWVFAPIWGTVALVVALTRKRRRPGHSARGRWDR